MLVQSLPVRVSAQLDAAQVEVVVCFHNRCACARVATSCARARVGGRSANTACVSIVLLYGVFTRTSSVCLLSASVHPASVATTRPCHSPYNFNRV